MDNDLDRCTICYAYVDLTGSHRAWHKKLDDKIAQLERLVNAL